jgi:hypothetical protein
MKPCPEAIRPAGRTGAKGKEAVERKQFYQVEIARRYVGRFFISARKPKSLARINKIWVRGFR